MVLFYVSEVHVPAAFHETIRCAAPQIVKLFVDMDCRIRLVGDSAIGNLTPNCKWLSPPFYLIWLILICSSSPSFEERCPSHHWFGEKWSFNCPVCCCPPCPLSLSWSGLAHLLFLMHITIANMLSCRSFYCFQYLQCLRSHDFYPTPR